MAEKELTTAERELCGAWTEYSMRIKEDFRTVQQGFFHDAISDLWKGDRRPAKRRLRQVLRDVDGNSSETEFPPDLIDKVREFCQSEN